MDERAGENCTVAVSHSRGRRRCAPYHRYMTSKLTAYIEAGYSLTPDERLEAARMLRLSVDQDADTDPAEVEVAWRDEVVSRINDILACNVELVDAEETYRLLSAELSSKRRCRSPSASLPRHALSFVPEQLATTTRPPARMCLMRRASHGRASPRCPTHGRHSRRWSGVRTRPASPRRQRSLRAAHYFFGKGSAGSRGVPIARAPSRSRP